MESIKQILEQRGYPEKAAILVSKELSNISPSLKPALDAWLKDTTETDVSAEGYSTSFLMQKQKGMLYPAALLSIDWLMKEPQIAKPIIDKGIQ